MTLFGSEKQRVLIARALAHQPKLFVLDEPTNHLDMQHQLELLELIHRLGMTTLLTLHDLNLAAAYCHRLYVLSHGQVVAEGRPEDALTPEIIHQVFSVRTVLGMHLSPAACSLRSRPCQWMWSLPKKEKAKQKQSMQIRRDEEQVARMIGSCLLTRA